MKPNLEPAKTVLRSFLADIEKEKKIRRSMSAPQMATTFSIEGREPLFNATEFTPELDSYWEKEDAYIWLYAEAWNSRCYRYRHGLVIGLLIYPADWQEFWKL